MFQHFSVVHDTSTEDKIQIWQNETVVRRGPVANLREGPGGPVPHPPRLFWVKKGKMTEGREAGWASKIEPGPLLSSKSGSATEDFLE